MARVRIIAGPHRSDRAKLIDALLHDRLANARLLLPTRRYARERALGLINRFDLPGLLGSPILAFEDFVSEIVRCTPYERRRVSATTQRVYFERAVHSVREAGAATGFDRATQTDGFLTHAQRVIAQLKQAAVDPSEFHARIASRPISRPIDRLVANIYTAYQEILHAEDAYDLPGLYWMADLCCRESQPAALANLSVLLADDFDDFTPAEFRILTALAQHVDELVFGLRLDSAPDRGDLYALPINTEKRLIAAFDAVTEHLEVRPPTTCAGFVTEHLFWRDPPTNPRGLTSNVHILACHDPRHELETIGRDIKHRIHRGDATLDRIAIVARNIEPMLPELKAVFAEFGIPLDCPKGDRFLDTAAGQFIARLSEALKHWDHQAFLALLTHRFAQTILGGEIEALRSMPSIVRAAGILNGRDAWFTAAERAAAQQPSTGLGFLHLVRRLMELDERLPFAGTLTEHLESFAAILHSIEVGSPPEYADSWQTLIACLAEWQDAIDESDATVPRAQFFERLLSIASPIRLASAAPIGGIACLDLAAARHLSFDHVYVVGVNERAVPARAQRSAVYGHADLSRLRSSGVDLESDGAHNERERLLFSHVFEIAQRGVTLSWHTVAANGQSAALSPFVCDVLDLLPGARVQSPESPAEVLVPPPDRVSSARDLLNCAQLESIELSHSAFPDLAAVRSGSQTEQARYASTPFDEFDGIIAGDSLIEILNARFGPDHVFSATEIETYVDCPFRFFAQRVLSIDDLERDPLELDPRERGQIMHSVLEKFHRHYLGTPWPNIEESEAFSTMRQIVDEAFARRPSRYSRTVWQVEHARMLALMQRYIAVERNRDDSAWSTHKLELSFGRGKPEDEGRDPCAFDSPAGAVRYSGIIDRVDLNAGSVRLVDYKSSISIAKKDLDAGSSMQLMLYTWAIEQLLPDQPCAAALYLAPGVAKTCEALDRAKPDVFASRVDSVRQQAANAVFGMRAGRFHVTVDKQPCRYCPAGKVCRYERARVERKCANIPTEMR